MIDVEIKNFQAIDSLALKIEGFTVLVGRTNIGKSSIVRAIKSALSGGSGSDFVRHDGQTCARVLKKAKSCKCFASVKLMFGEGQGLLWEKGSKGLNRYTVWKNGVESVYDRVGQSMELPEFLGAQFAPIKLGPSQSLLQVCSQFDAPFLLDLSGGVVADILSDIGQLDDINQAMTAVAKDCRTASATRKVREADVVTQRQRLEVYAGFDVHLRRVRTLQQQGVMIQADADRLQLADRFISEATEGTKALQRLTLALAAKLPETVELRQTSESLGRVSEFIEDWEPRVEAVARLEKVLQVPLPDSLALTARVTQRRRVSAFEAALLERERLVARLEPLERVALPSDAGMKAHCQDLTRISTWLDALTKLKVTFGKATGVQGLAFPETGPVTALVKRLVTADRLASRQTRLDQEIKRSETALEESEQEGQVILAEFAELGICPTCHQDITPEQVLACHG